MTNSTRTNSAEIDMRGIKAESHMYASYFCEENVYHLAATHSAHRLSKGITALYAVFVSNPQRQVRGPRSTQACQMSYELNTVFIFFVKQYWPRLMCMHRCMPWLSILAVVHSPLNPQAGFSL